MQFDGMGTAAGPPAKTFGTGVGSAVLIDTMLAARNKTMGGEARSILRSDGSDVLHKVR